MEVVYIDVMAALNLAVDFLLLAATARLAGVFVPRWKLLCGAILGAAYAVFSVLPVPEILLWLPVRLAVGFFMVMITFGRDAPLARLYALFLVVSCALAGLSLALYLMTGVPTNAGGVYYVEVPFRIVLGACILAYAVAGLVLRGTAKHGAALSTTQQVTLTAFGRTESFTLLLDSGCDLTDPISGRPVLVLERQAVARLLPPDLRFLCTALAQDSAPEAFSRIPAEHKAAFRLLPFRAVGTAGGLLLMFRPQTALRAGKAFETYAAISPYHIANGQYEGLIGI